MNRIFPCCKRDHNKDGNCDVHRQGLVQMSVQEYQARAGESYELGQVAFAEGLPQRLLQQAGAAFALKQDDEAKWLRRLAEQFEKEAKQMRMRWNDNARKLEKEYPNE